MIMVERNYIYFFTFDWRICGERERDGDYGERDGDYVMDFMVCVEVRL